MPQRNNTHLFSGFPDHHKITIGPKPRPRRATRLNIANGGGTTDKTSFARGAGMRHSSPHRRSTDSGALPNVQDEPRLQRARLVPHSEFDRLLHIGEGPDSTRRDRCRRWLWRLVGLRGLRVRAPQAQSFQRSNTATEKAGLPFSGFPERRQ